MAEGKRLRLQNFRHWFDVGTFLAFLLDMIHWAGAFDGASHEIWNFSHGWPFGAHDDVWRRASR